MSIIDVQVHAYERNYPGRPWAGHLHGPDSANGQEMVAAMDAVGVDAAIIVSTFNLYRHDPSYALEVYNTYPERFRVVVPVDPTDPAMDSIVADWAKTKGAVGLRIMLRDELLSDPADPRLNRAFAAAGRNGLPVNFLCWGRLDDGTELAKRPNAVIKVSGACTLSREPFPYNDIWDPVMKIIDVFGIDRCMWGTDWTRTSGMVTYEQGVKPFLLTDRLSDSDRAALMGGTLERVYKW